MCGIAGYIGKNELPLHVTVRTLELMENRGPDTQQYKTIKYNETNIYLLHSRLSIIDLDRKADQPYSERGYSIIFNGEIYNYVELRKNLINEGIQFKTKCDTEVLLQYYIKYGEKCVDFFEGMWCFAIYDPNRGGLFLSRDRFGEKPLFYYETSNGIYFGSEIQFLKSLSGSTFTINDKHICRYLVNGYRALYKSGEFFYNELRELDRATNMFIDFNLKTVTSNYWVPLVTTSPLTFEEAVEGTRYHLYESLKIRMRSDVPLAFCLSGGIDSSLLVSIAKKIYHYDVATFSIIDDDERYDERANIQSTVNDLVCKNIPIKVQKKSSLTKLKNVIKYHGSPVSTISYYLHSLLSNEIAKHGYKVAISGTGADELFTGYYDHFNLHLYELKDSDLFETRLREWKMYIAPLVRNPYLKNPMMYLENPNERRHNYLNNDEYVSYLKFDFAEPFIEKFYCSSILRNRMLNELFYESVPVMLHEDDLNSMMYSVENRSPYLDKNLFEFAYSIPTQYLIQNGYAKAILREAGRGVLNNEVRLDRKKKGFNTNVKSVFDFNCKDNREYLLDDSKVYNIVKKGSIERLMNNSELSNSSSKFMFNFMNAKIFMDMN